MTKNPKKGQKVLVRKPEDVSEYPQWHPEMDKYDGKVLVVGDVVYWEEVGMMRLDGWNFNASWLIPATELGKALYE